MLAAGVLLGGCFEDVESPESGTSGTEGDTGTTGASADLGTGNDDEPDTGSDDDPDTGSDDGAVECAPTERCLALSPAGWEGPVAYFEGDDLDTLPSCAAPFGGLSIEVHDQISGTAPDCEACSCGAASDVQCSSPTVRFYHSSSCDEFGDDPASEFMLGPQGDCTVFPNGDGAYGAEADPVTPLEGTGSCVASGGEATIADADWAVELRACAAPEATTVCGDERACVPSPGAPFASELCIYRPGDVACPAGDYAARFLRYGAYEDSRECSECECGAPSGGSCDAGILFSNTNTCVEDYLTLPMPGSGGCTTLWGSTPSSGVLEVYDVAGAACAASGGEGQGEVMPADPVTFCCTE